MLYISKLYLRGYIDNMKLSAKDTIRLLMRINDIGYQTISDKTGYNKGIGSAKAIARDSHMQIRTFAKFLAVFGGKIFVKYPFPDGTIREVEIAVDTNGDVDTKM